MLENYLIFCSYIFRQIWGSYSDKVNKIRENKSKKFKSVEVVASSSY